MLFLNSKLRTRGLFMLILGLVIGLVGFIWRGHPKANSCRTLKKTDSAVVTIANRCAAQVRDINSIKISNISEYDEYWRIYYIVKQRKVSADGLWVQVDFGDRLTVQIDRATCEAKLMPRM